MAMTTSATRSRRAEGLQVSHPQKILNGHHRLVNAKAAAAAHGIQQNNSQFTVSSPPRAKRQLEISAHDCDSVVPKKVRIEVGIPSRSAFQPRPATKPTADAKHPQSAATPTSKPAIAADLPPPNPEPPARAAAAAAAATTAPPTATTTTTISSDTAAKQQPRQPARTKHQEKVVSGLKHELDRLQPNAADTKSQGGRKLRSQEVTRFKSELSSYFPDYDEVIGNDPKEEHMLNVDTPIVITSDAAPCTTRPPPHISPIFPVHSYGDALYTTLHDAKEIDLDFLVKSYSNKSHDGHDPLPDSLYEPTHKKAERQERTIRNTERGYAQHEKEVIIRLLDGLHGHDWLRVMGVSGVTESRKKQYEPAREYFIKGCQTILDKFKRWTAEEKRRKREKERKAAEEEKRAEREATTSAEAEDDDDSDDEEGEEQEIPDSDADDDAEAASSEEEIADTDEEPPDDSDDEQVSIAKQLREEAALAASSKVAKKQPRKAPPPAPSKSRRRGGKAQQPRPPVPPPPANGRRSRSARQESHPPPPPKEFTSFFEKRYQRDAALSKTRRRNRNVLAWGKPVPEVEERDFELPAEFLDADTLKSRARRKRRDTRAKH